MAEDEDLLDAIKEWEDRCKEAERQSAALMKAVDWMSQRIKILESERDSANLQIRDLIDALRAVYEAQVIPMAFRSMALEAILRNHDASKPKRESDERLV